MKKYKLTRNPGLKIIAFVFAVLLWLIVANVDDPVARRTYSDIPVVYTAVTDPVAAELADEDGNPV